jgi:hypothetical protein
VEFLGTFSPVHSVRQVFFRADGSAVILQKISRLIYS